MSPGPPRPREDLEDLRAYRVSSPPAPVRLHSNESPWPPPPEVAAEVLAALERVELHRYPDIEAGELRAELARYCGVAPEWVWVGTGSNEVLLQACLAYGGPGRTALVFEPTYRMHHRQARIAGTRVETVWRGAGFAIDPDEAVAAVKRLRPHLVFVCSPNNPTGTLTPPEDVARIAEACEGLVVVDEAYHEFCGVTVLPLLDRLPNLLVVRTLSKAFRLAGARLGYGVGHPRTLEPLLKVRMPYGQSSLAQAAALVAVRRRDRLLGAVGEVVAERERLAGELARVPGAEVFPSHANFVLFRHPRAPELASGLASRGILVRDFSSLPGCEGCLRVTVGTREENDAFLEALRALAC